MRKEVKEYVQNNYKYEGGDYSHHAFYCIFNNTKYRSITMFPTTAVNLLTNKILFHEFSIPYINQAKAIR